MSSKTRRLAAEREILNRYGDQGVYCELQGNLFFGTTDQLFSLLESDLRTKQYILFDMRRVQSMDFTAAHLFKQMHTQLVERRGRLIFSDMPSALIDQRDFEYYLAQLGESKEGGGIMILETLDDGLEWMEERILELAGVTREDENQLLEVEDFDLFRGFDEMTFRGLADCMETRSVPQGQMVFSEGDPGNEIYFIRRGGVRVLLTLEGGKHHHLATIDRGDFFGELSFLDQEVRSAGVEAKVTSDFYVLSRKRFDELFASHASLGVQFFIRLAITIAHRLRQSDAELRALEER